MAAKTQLPKLRPALKIRTPSIRQVSLLAARSPTQPGDPLTWSGRTYRVEAVQPLPQQAELYLHLAAPDPL